MSCGHPVASVLIPTRSRPEKLTRALTSVVRQSFTCWEAVVIDDGDGDGAWAARQLGDSRVRAYSNAGQGQVDARNTAIVLAQGDFICWLDDDDWWDDPFHLERLRSAAAPDSLYFRGGWIVFEGRGEESCREVFNLDATPESLRLDNTILTSSIAYVRSAHRTLGLLDSTVGSYWDWDLLLRITGAGYHPRKLATLGVCYSVHRDNTSADISSQARKAMFDRLVAKHGLTATMKNHLIIHEELGQEGNRDGVAHAG